MNHGRPTKTAQVQIQEKLRRYFEYGITATLAAEKTGMNIKTVCKYFDEWSERLVEQQSSEYFERQKIERERIIISLDRQIVSVIESLDDIENEIQKYKDENKAIPRYLFSHRLEIQKFIASLIEKKGAFVLQIPVDEALKQKIAEMLREHATRPSS